MVIAIGGVSRAGKTTLANRLRNQVIDKSVTILCQDDFVQDLAKIPKIQDRVDWEHPDSIDHEAFREAIIEADKKFDIVIVEGLLVYYDSKTIALYDKKIFVEIDYDTFLYRKERDHRWGIEPAWYIIHIWESFFKYNNIDFDDSLLVVSGKVGFVDSVINAYLGFE